MRLHKLIVTVCGLVYAPKAPGTFGTLGAVLLFSLSYFLQLEISLTQLIILIIISAGVGVYSTNKIIGEWGDDPSRVVIDEFVGYLITMILIPLNMTNIILGFLLFRFFDILKPLGIGIIDQKVKGGLGVMLDDVLAGIYACLILHLINYFI